MFGEGEETLLLLPPWSIVHSRFWKAQVPYLARHFRVVTFDPRGNGRSDRPDTRRRATARARTPPTRSPCSTPPAPRAACSSPTARSPAAPCCSPPSTPERVVGAALHVARAADLTPPRPERTGYEFDGRADPLRGLGEGQPPLLAAGLPRLPRVLLRPRLPGAALDEADRGRDRLGRSRATPETLALHDRGAGHSDERDGARAARPHPLPAARHPGRRGPADPRPTAARPSPRPTGAELVEFEGVGHLPQRAPPGAVQPDAARLRRARLAAPAAAARPGAARSAARKRALYVSSPIGLGHAWRDVAIARELRALAPRPRDRLARAGAGHAACSRRCGERIHPASRHLALESRHIAAEARGHELNVFQAWRRMDEILLANFMLFHDVATRGSVRPVDRRRGVGARLLPAREPRAQDRRLRVPDRLRRLAADGRGRRRRGAADRRLQRRDDRAGRALPARARPRAVRRQPRGRRAPLVRPRPAADRARGSTTTSTSPATRSAPASRRTARRCAPSSATRPTSACASSRSAARASAAGCSSA